MFKLFHVKGKALSSFVQNFNKYMDILATVSDVEKFSMLWHSSLLQWWGQFPLDQIHSFYQKAMWNCPHTWSACTAFSLQEMRNNWKTFLSQFRHEIFETFFNIFYGLALFLLWLVLIFLTTACCGRLQQTTLPWWSKDT